MLKLLVIIMTLVCQFTAATSSLAQQPRSESSTNYDGFEVIVMGDGIVSFASWVTGSGKVIIVDHGNGVRTRYKGLSQIFIEVGQKVKKGEVIGFLPVGHPVFTPELLLPENTH